MKKFLIISIFVVLSVLFLSNCARTNKVYIDMPEIFTRERLINERINDRTWLEGKLKEKYVPGIQGYQDIRSFMGLIAQLQMLNDPLSGQRIREAIAGESVAKTQEQSLREMEYQNKVQQLQQQQEINKLYNELDILKLQKKIEETEKLKEIKDAEMPVPKDVEIKESGSRVEELKKEFSSQEYAAPAKSSFEGVEYGDPSKLVKSTAELTSLEKLQDEKAYRDQIKALLRETELDDVHETYGNTIYTLKYDVTIDSQKPFRKKFWHVDLSLEVAPYSSEDYYNLYKRWVKAFENEMKREIMNLMNKFKMGKLSDEERMNILFRVQKSLDEKADELKKVNELKYFKELNESEETKKLMTSRKPKMWIKLIELMKAMESIEKKKMNLSKEEMECLELVKLAVKKKKIESSISSLNKIKNYLLKINSTNDWSDDDELLRVLIKRTISKYDFLTKYCILNTKSTSLNDMIKQPGEPIDFEITKNDNISTDIVDDCLEQINEESEKGKYEKLRLFLNFVKALEESRKNSTYVYYVEPKEYSQNISQVAANEKMLNFIASLKSIFAVQGKKIQSNFEYLFKKQSLLQAILRQPLVVAFASGQKKFGWILGPRFELNGDKPTFKYKPVQYSLQATIVVPGWYDKLRIETKTYWGKEKSLLERTQALNPWKKNASNSEQSVCIKLTPDLSTITRALWNKVGSFRKPPMIYANDFRLQAGKKQQILIQGENLWKSPEVFIGGQKANDIRVLPDMKGLHVTFEEVLDPAQADDSGVSRVDLVVITSDGANTLSDAVEIIPEKKKEIPSKGMLESSYTYNGGDFKISIPGKLLSGNPIIEIYERNKAKGNWSRIEGAPVSTIKGEFAIVVIKDVKIPGNSEEKIALAQLRSLENNTTTTVPLEGSFAYFANVEESKANLLNTHLECSIIKINDEKNKNRYCINGDIDFSFKNPDLFLVAFPDLQYSQKDNITLNLKATKADNKAEASFDLNIPKEAIKFEKMKDKTGLLKIKADGLNSDSIGKIRDLVELINSTGGSRIFDLILETNRGYKIEVNNSLTLTLSLPK